MIKAHLREAYGTNSPNAQLSAVSSIHQFDSACELGDNESGVCGAGRFRPTLELTPQAIAGTCEQVRVHVLRRFAPSGLIDPDDIREMLAWKNSGVSLDGAVRVAAGDRTGVAYLLRYCARPLDVWFVEYCRRS